MSKAVGKQWAGAVVWTALLAIGCQDKPSAGKPPHGGQSVKAYQRGKSRSFAGAGSKGRKSGALADLPQEPVSLDPKNDPLDAAYTAALGMGDQKEKDKALGRAAVNYANAGRIRRALKVTKEIESPNERLVAVKVICKALFQKGRHRAAIDMVDWFHDQKSRTEMKRFLVALFSEARLLNQGLAQARRIRSSNERARALLQIAQTLHGHPNKAKVDLVLEEIESVLPTIQGLWGQRVALEVAEWLVGAGRLVKAVEIARRAIKTARADKGNSKLRIMLQSRGAMVMARAGQLKEALRVVDGIDEPSGCGRLRPGKSDALEQIADKYVELGRIKEALKVARRVSRRRGLRPPTQPSYLMELMAKLARAGHVEKALRAVRSWRILRSPVYLVFIAVGSAEGGHIQKALRLVRTLPSPSARVAALEKIAEILHSRGRRSEVDSVLGRAAAAARTVRKRSLRAWELAVLARTCLDLKRPGPVAALVGDARNLLKGSDEELGMARGLLPILGAVGKCRQAARWVRRLGYLVFDQKHGLMESLVRQCLKRGEQEAVRAFLRNSRGRGRMAMIAAIRKWFAANNKSPVSALKAEIGRRASTQSPGRRARRRRRLAFSGQMVYYRSFP